MNINIRDAGFWPAIEQLFPFSEQAVTESARSDLGKCLCTPAQLFDRIRASRQRAERNGNYVLLIRLQLDEPDQRRESGQKRDTRAVQMNRLNACLRASDSLCDLGRGNLALLMGDIHDTAVVPLVIEKLMATLAGVTAMGRPARYSKPCAGATVFPVDGLSDEKAWEATESALSRAMKAGAGAYRFSHRVTGRAAKERFELGRDLYEAYRNNEFETVYQPIMDLVDQRIHAVEVFLRWQHPLHGNLAPELFLPILEESGLIVPVGEQMLANACQFLAGLQAEGCEGVRCCINISPRQLEDSGFLLSIMDALYDADLDPGRLQLEFQESILAKYPRLVRRILPELRTAGIHLALDHFGTSEVPLAELVRSPIDLLKLDQSLIKHIVEDSTSQAIISGTLALAVAAGMQVGAVGVEQSLQTDMLGRLGCREAQGHYYSVPLSGAELCSLLGNPAH